MSVFTATQPVRQLEPRRGAYFYLVLPSEVVEGLSEGRSTRLICHLEGGINYRCGLNHLGDGNFFIILSKKNLEKAGKALGEEIRFEIEEDPDQLGVKMPEFLTVLLDQDPELKAIFDRVTFGKKRSLIYAVNKIKDIDLQVQRATEKLLEMGRKA